MPDLLPLFLTLAGRDVVLVGGGPVAAAKLKALLDTGARVRVIAPAVTAAIECAGVEIVSRGFVPADLDGAWLAVAAATPEVNREVARAAESRRIFVNAVDDPINASAFLSGTIRRGGVTIAVSTSGDAPGLTALIREALDAMLPADVDRWMEEARRQRILWRQNQVPMAERKPRLLEALNELYDGSGLRGRSSDPAIRSWPAGLSKRPAAAGLMPADQAKPQPGHVSLVGAGPGDPALLTRKAIARLRAADLVLYDALIDDRILRYARKAQRFFAGKRAGRHAMTQQTIHAVMIRAARRGRRVVRLKGGDPFVFGRGGEEALALHQAGVAFDVVPGVTCAVAAPELAGIPVTYRGVSSAFLVISGHDEKVFASAIGELQPNGVTLVVLMGLGRAAGIRTALLGRGWSPETPAAVIFSASAPEQWVWRGRLGELLEGSRGSKGSGGVEGPATIVIGDAVALAAVNDENEGATTERKRKYVTRK